MVGEGAVIHGAKLPEYCLREQGHNVCVPDIPSTGSLKARSAKLEQAIKAFFPDGVPLHLIAHSMGGLNARDIAKHSAVERHGLNIRSVTTLATPHHGSYDATAANLLTAGYPHRFPFGAFNVKDLTFHTVDKFNRATPDNKNVLYLSWAGMSDTAASLYSACWGNFLGAYDVDHRTLPKTLNLVLETLPILREANCRSPEFCAFRIREVRTQLQEQQQFDEEVLKLSQLTLATEARWRTIGELVDRTIKYIPGTRKLRLWHT